ncbi:hypothetical protein C8R46DRAFT_1361710 [Mycena filopes]|nr:hypothetical protein C8R46DRAFT_1361710 [Mycena filopes]
MPSFFSKSAPRPPVLSVQMRENQRRLRDASLRLRQADPVDKWLEASRVWYGTPERAIDSINPQREVLVDIWTSFTPGEVEDPFRDPDIFTMHMEVHQPSDSGPAIKSPRLLAAFYAGSRDDGDAPAWLELIPGETYNFAQPREFMAQVFCGLSDLWVGDVNYNDNISSEMLWWATRYADGTPVKAKMPPVLSRSSPAHSALLGSTRYRKYSPAQIYEWLRLNRRDAWARDVLLPGYLTIHSVGMEQLLCEVQRVDMVRRQIRGMTKVVEVEVTSTSTVV